MKLPCQVDIVNRIHSDHNLNRGGKYARSTVALLRDPKHNQYVIMHISNTNKNGVRYELSNIKQVFTKFMKEGKATIRFTEPPHDMYIKCDANQLKSFLKALKQCITGDTKNLRLERSDLPVKNINTSTKLVIHDPREVPPSLPRNLVNLCMSGLKLKRFRSDILELKKLQCLDFSNNLIASVPPGFGDKCYVTELYLANNKLGEEGPVDWRWLFGPQITSCLKLLDLRKNSLSSIPNAIWKLKHLVTLKLDHNRLTNLPSAIGSVTALKYFSVSHNKLTTLPCSLLQCCLEHLDIYGNNFHEAELGYTPCAIGETPWQFYIGNLVHIAAKVILKNKITYRPGMIPITLVGILDNANVCVCGAPVMNDQFYVNRQFPLKDFYNTIVFDNNRQITVTFKCFFCSPKCYAK